MEKDKNADKRVRSHGLRRKSGLDRLSTTDERSDIPSSWEFDASILPTPSSPERPPVKSFLAPLEALKLDRENEYARLKAKRATWESSLPTNFKRHSNHVTPGHTLEYIDQGVPTPRKRPEEFNVSTKHKRRNSSQ